MRHIERGAKVKIVCVDGRLLDGIISDIVIWDADALDAAILISQQEDAWFRLLALH